MATLKLRKKTPSSKKTLKSKKTVGGKKKAPAKKTSRSKGEPKHTIIPFAAETIFKHRTSSPKEIARIIRREFPKAAKKWDDSDWILTFAGRLNRGTTRAQRNDLVGKPPKRIALVGMAKAS